METLEEKKRSLYDAALERVHNKSGTHPGLLYSAAIERAHNAVFFRKKRRKFPSSPSESEFSESSESSSDSNSESPSQSIFSSSSSEFNREDLSEELKEINESVGLLTEELIDIRSEIALLAGLVAAESGGGTFSGTVTGLDTSSIATGLFGYVSSNNVLLPTDSLALVSSEVFGCGDGVSGEAVVVGAISAKFTSIGGQPNPGDKVWLAASTDEAGAAGKLTATAPSAGMLAEVGVCVDNSLYASIKQAKILIQVKEPIIL